MTCPNDQTPNPSLYRCGSLALAIIALALVAFVWANFAEAAPLSDRDVNLGKKAFALLERNKWRRAAKIAEKIRNRDVGDIVHWAMFSEPRAGATFAALSDFLIRRPDWPNTNRIQRRAEETMPADMDPGAVLTWFAAHPPVGANGMIRRAEALLALGRNKEGRKAIREVWVKGVLGRGQYKTFYRKHRKLLTHDDHVARLDRLIWKGDHRAARWMLYRVNKDYRALGLARILLMRMEGNVDAAIANVPERLRNHAGLLYERTRWRRRKGKDAAAREFLENPPATLTRPGKWWRERYYLARRALTRKNHVDAYLLAANHGIRKPGADLAEAEFFSGWIALRFLNKPDIALKHFRKLFQSVRFPISLARGAYWMGRALEASGDGKGALKWYEKAARHPTTYYGQLAWSKAHPDENLRLAPTRDLPIEMAAEVREHPLAAAAKILARLDEQDRLDPFVRALSDLRDDPDWKGLVAQLAGRLGRPDLSIYVAKTANRAGLTLPRALYPTLTPPPIPGTNGKKRPREDLEIPLVLAMIRQESAFRPRAKSHANARGLMQIIPGTAYRVARRVGLPFSKQRLLNDPSYNMKLGQAYMAGLLDDYGGSYVLALSAYNAGPARVGRWMKSFGDPKDPKIDAIDWVEWIPYDETRNYVQRVLENTRAYRVRLQAPGLAMNMARDLARRSGSPP